VRWEIDPVLRTVSETGWGTGKDAGTGFRHAPKKKRGGGSAPPRRFLLDFPIPNYDFDSLCKS
jgi:hypothetical protein